MLITKETKMALKKKKTPRTPETVASESRYRTANGRLVGANKYKNTKKYSKEQFLKDKNNHSSIVEKNMPTELRAPIIDDMYMHKMMPVSDSIKQRIADRLVTWIKSNPDNCVLARFLEENNLSWDSYLRWKDEHSGLKSAHNYALTALGARREEKYISPQFVAQTISVYNPLYKEHEEWKSQLRAKEAKAGSAPTKITVIDHALRGDDE